VANLGPHRINDFTNEKHLTDTQKDAAVGSFGTPGSSNRYVTEGDSRVRDGFPFSGASVTRVAIFTNESGAIGGEETLRWNSSYPNLPPGVPDPGDDGSASENFSPGVDPNIGVFYDHGGWFNYGAPDRFTVPSGVSLVRILVELQPVGYTAEGGPQPPGGHNFMYWIEKNSGGRNSRIAIQDTARNLERVLLVTPPWEARSGDQFRVVFGWWQAAGVWSLSFGAWTLTESRFAIEKVA
jgi:hypothetical protein